MPSGTATCWRFSINKNTIELFRDKYPFNALLALKQSLLLSVTTDLPCSPTEAALRLLYDGWC